MGGYHSKDMFEAIEKNNRKRVKKIVKKTKRKFEQTSNQDGQTPLQMASNLGCSEIVQLLLDNDFNCNVPDGKCWFPIHYACSGGHIGVIKVLTSAELGMKKADVNSHCVVGYCKCQKQTALHVACCKGYKDCAVLLLAMGASLKFKDKDENTPYDVAVRRNYTDIAEFIKPFLNRDTSQL